MRDYTSIGFSQDGEIKVEIQGDKQLEALFSQDKVRIGNMSFVPVKDTEIVIRLIIKSKS